MAGTFLQSFMICLQRLDQSGRPVGADEEEKSNVSPRLMSPPGPSAGDHPCLYTGTTPCPRAGAENPPPSLRGALWSHSQALCRSRQDLPSKQGPRLLRCTQLPPTGRPQAPQSPTWIILLEVGEVHVGVEDWRDGGELAQLLVLLPALQAALVVGQPITLALRCGRRGCRGGGGGRAAGPGALGLAVVWAEETAPLPAWGRTCHRSAWCEGRGGPATPQGSLLQEGQPQLPRPPTYLLSRNGDWQTPEYDSKETAPGSEPRETLPVREGRGVAGRAELGQSLCPPRVPQQPSDNTRSPPACPQNAFRIHAQSNREEPGAWALLYHRHRCCSNSSAPMTTQRAGFPGAEGESCPSPPPTRTPPR